MTDRPSDPADKAADGAFGGQPTTASHRAGYGDRLATVEYWMRQAMDRTLASGEGRVLMEEIDRLRKELKQARDENVAYRDLCDGLFADKAKIRATLELVQAQLHDVREELGAENDKLRAAIDRVRALHQPLSKVVGWGTLVLCAKCLDEDNDLCLHPCPTLRAIDGEGA